MQKKQLQKIVKRLVESSFKDSSLVESQVVKSIRVLKALPIGDAIPAMSQYLESVKREERNHTLFIETAQDLSSIQINKVKDLVEKRIKINKTLVSVNPEIIGGFKIKIGDEVWDETLVAKINQLKEVISGRPSN